jgi:hypothetical protein
MMLAKFHSVQLDDDIDPSDVLSVSPGHPDELQLSLLPLNYAHSKEISSARNKLAGGRAGDDIPRTLCVQCCTPENHTMACSGIYELQPGVLVNHLPTWVKKISHQFETYASRHVLFSANMGCWAIGGSKAIAPDGVATVAFATSCSHEEGVLNPHLTRWHVTRAPHWGSSDGAIDVTSEKVRETNLPLVIILLNSSSVVLALHVSDCSSLMR